MSKFLFTEGDDDVKVLRMKIGGGGIGDKDCCSCRYGFVER